MTPHGTPRVCILTETYYPEVGGGEIQAQMLSEALVGKGYEVMVVTRRSRSSLLRTERIKGVQVYRLPPAGAGHLKKWGLLLTTVPVLLVHSRRYDLVLVSGYRVLGTPAVLLSRLMHKRCILKADSLGEMSGAFFESGLAQFGLRLTSGIVRAFLLLRNHVLRRADGFVAISSDIRAEMTSQGVDPCLVRDIPNSVDTRRFTPAGVQRKADLRQKLDLPPNVPIVIYTGRLVTYKGLPLLLQVWEELHRQHDQAVLVLVGGGSLDMHNCEDDLRHFVRSKAMTRCIRFTGNVDNVNEFLQASDIFVLPTENDAFPLSLIEAMACGLAVVSTRVGAVKEIISHMSNGILLRPGDGRQLREALENLLGDSRLSARLGHAAQLTAKHRYSVTGVTQMYIEIFSAVLRSG